MSTAFEVIKYALDKTEAIPDRIGYRSFKAYIVTTVWTGKTIGAGDGYTTTTQIVLDGYYSPFLDETYDKTVFSGNSKNTCMLGPIPESYSVYGKTGGYSKSSFILNTKNSEIYIKIVDDNNNNTSYWTISRIHESKSKISNKLELTRRAGNV